MIKTYCAELAGEAARDGASDSANFGVVGAEEADAQKNIQQIRRKRISRKGTSKTNKNIAIKMKCKKKEEE